MSVTADRVRAAQAVELGARSFTYRQTGITIIDLPNGNWIYQFSICVTDLNNKVLHIERDSLDEILDLVDSAHVELASRPDAP